METSIRDLDARGFTIVRGFLDEDELEFLRSDFAKSQPDGNMNYPLRAPSPEAVERVRHRVDEVLESVHAQSTVRADDYAGAAYFATHMEMGIDFPWHQDHESYFIFQNHHDYLNFYMPIVKPDASKSNMSVVPYDVLEREAPRTHKLLVGSGASRFHSIFGRLLSVSDETGAIRRVGQTMDDFGYTPELAAGDLLIMRGDVIHRTQDTSTTRVAFSYRVVDYNTVITRERLVSGGLQKALMMSNFAGEYESMFKVFDAAGNDAMTVAEMREVGERVGRAPAVRRRIFLLHLLREKRRAHTLTGFVFNVPVALAWRTLLKVQERWRGVRRNRVSD